MKPKHFCSAALCCILILLSACNKDDNDNPLRFYNDTYEVPMGGIRYLGLESGNGDYSLEVEDQRLISAQVEHGWSTPGGSAIYVRGILTGKTTLKVTDAATLESCLLKIKVVDNYEAMQLAGADLHCWRMEPQRYYPAFRIYFSSIIGHGMSISSIGQFQPLFHPGWCW
jgi:hypothetical protein